MAWLWLSHPLQREFAALADECHLAVAIRAERERTVSEGETLYVMVMPTRSATAVPLLAGLFDGAEDTVWQPPS